MLIQDWRMRWQQGIFPFLFVQLADFREKRAIPGDDLWAELREAQDLPLQQPATGMASAIDIGDPLDVHPRNKLDVGKRLYLAARKVAYGESLTYSGLTTARITIHDMRTLHKDLSPCTQQFSLLECLISG